MLAVLLGLVVFLAAGFLDYAYVRYQESVAQRAEHAAGTWSVMIYIVGSVGWFSILSASAWYILPELLGLYAGTIIAIRRSKRLMQEPRRADLQLACQALK